MKMIRRWGIGAATVVAAGLLLAVGCASKQEPGAGPGSEPGNVGPSRSLSPDIAKLTPNGAGTAGGMANPHGAMMAGVPNPHAAEKGGKENPQVVKAVDAAAAAEAKLKANPKDVALKQQAAKADYRAGDLMMNASTQPPHEKYSGALRYFRRALELDPANQGARTGKDLIEGIYKQMGRPIPQ